MGFITFNQYQYGFRLTETGQVEKITVLAVGILTVRIALCRRCRKETAALAGAIFPAMPDGVR